MFINVSMYIEAAWTINLNLKLLKCEFENSRENFYLNPKWVWRMICWYWNSIFLQQFQPKKGTKRICFKFSSLSFFLFTVFFSVLLCHSHSKVLRAWCQRRAQKKNKVKANIQQQQFHLEMLLLRFYSLKNVI